MEKIYIIGHKNPDTDSVCAAIAYAEFKKKSEGEDCIAARAGELNKETEFVLNYFKVDAPPILKSIAGKKVILVDHFESGQVVDGFKEAEIFEVIDHHRIGDLETSKPILYRAEPVGSTSTIIAEMYFYHKLKLTKQMAGIMLASILSDTVVLRSSTCTDKDRKMANKLAKTAKVKNIEAFGMDIKKAKASLKGMTPKQVLMSDYKEFNFPKGSIGVGQIEVVDTQEANAMQNELLAEMEKLWREKKNKLVALMVTNIVEEHTDLLVVGAVDIAEKAFEKKPVGNCIRVPGGMSRKKNIVPAFETVLR